MRNKVLLCFLLITSIHSYAQIVGGGPSFATAVTFDQAWLTGCPSGSISLSNTTVEPSMDGCAPTPACASGTTGSDVWFKFIAQAATASIVINPTSAFDVAIQAFSGTGCPVPGLTQIGCVDAGGNNVTETLNLTGLTVNTVYYFRIFGATNAGGARTGIYTFCSSTGLGSTFLPVEISRFNASGKNNTIELNWTTESESNNAYFEIERSADGNYYESIGNVAGIGTTTQTAHYSFTDVVPFTSNNYYRLKQVDIDGRYKYSAIVNIRLNSNLRKMITASPNPIADKIRIQISSDLPTYGRLRIINNSGQVVYQKTENLLKGENVFVIANLDNLTKGIYTVQVITPSEIITTKLIK